MTAASAKLLIDGFERVREEVAEALDGLTPEELAWRGHDQRTNPVGWLVWHLSRVQDLQISDVAELPEVWIAQDWHQRFALPYPVDASGYGASSTQVQKFTAPVELLAGYHEAVHRQTVDYLATLHDRDYGRIVDTAWDPPVTLGVRLISILSDDLQHVGQAAFVRGCLARR
ncbi:mycothiol transferase [Kitasatospora azatica]|uniref:mycothiol transferase n=1 Tax=Kitasatospora azatica TaxID=58347 RepID=UPI000B020420|nr:DinB family protein [Kitasatospora azatica]